MGAPLGTERATTKRAKRVATTRDLDWAAGFLEGEGTFTYSSTTEVVSATQTDNSEPIMRLLDIFGGSVYTYPQKYGEPENWKTKTSWQVHGSRARGVMMTLYVLMSRRKRVDIKFALGKP